MPQHAPAPRICRDCDGFATAVIITGNRHRDGSRTTIPVTCPTCKGTGTTTPATLTSSVGR
ncbi:hypothetical protein ACH4PU_22425 [Streptomyces sp. NPDC021100]|uniref:hypothetical protein n=1 Tax=Streptomyces sp. NPDC021100 TaxID=3365114 RepID=UPI003799DEE5